MTSNPSRQSRIDPAVDLADIIGASLRANRNTAPRTGPDARTRRGGKVGRAGQGDRNLRRYAFRRS